MRYKAIIFDMDGTITDTENVWFQANKALVEKRIGPVSKEQMNELHKQTSGASVHHSCQIIKNAFSLPDHIEEIMLEKSRYAREIMGKEIRFITGFTNFHAYTQKHKLPTAIATNALHDIIDETDKALNLRKFFGKHIYSIQDVGNRMKPDPAVYLHAAQKLGVKPHECLAIEDSLPGVSAAKNAGMFCIGIKTSKIPGQTDHADLQVEGYEHINLPVLLHK